MKVLHTADTHLGDLTGPTKDGQNLRRLDTLRCMEAIVASAQAEKPDLAIIAGDLFNRSRVWADIGEPETIAYNISFDPSIVKIIKFDGFICCPKCRTVKFCPPAPGRK